MSSSEIWGAANAAKDPAVANAAKQSLRDANAAMGTWMLKVQQLEGHAVYAAMTQAQQYPLQYAVNATRGFGETIQLFRFRFAAKPAITVSVSFHLVSMFRATQQHPKHPAVLVRSILILLPSDVTTQQISTSLNRKKLPTFHPV